jgi:hypothetical protein
VDRVKDAMVAGNRKGVESAAQRMGVSGGEESHKGHGGHKGILTVVPNRTIPDAILL